MLPEKTASLKLTQTLAMRLRDYGQLLKPNLSMLVVFSSVVGYLLAPGVHFELGKVLLLFLGGMLVTGSANVINQILERFSDRLMKRTAGRPLPEERMSVTEAWIVVGISGAAGLFILAFYFNEMAAWLSLLSLILYAFAYTPMKKRSPAAVFVGAIPGAFPPLLGYVAAAGAMGLSGFEALMRPEGWTLFLFQFFWQFPHFWAIAWLGFEDYEKAGIRLLPSREGRTRFTGLQCMLYSVVLVPISLVARAQQLTGDIGMYVCMAAGIMYFAASVNFYRKNDRSSARKVMFASFIYLPVILLALLLDKF